MYSYIYIYNGKKKTNGLNIDRKISYTQTYSVWVEESFTIYILNTTGPKNHLCLNYFIQKSSLVCEMVHAVMQWNQYVFFELSNAGGYSHFPAAHNRTQHNDLNHSLGTTWLHSRHDIYITKIQLMCNNIHHYAPYFESMELFPCSCSYQREIQTPLYTVHTSLCNPGGYGNLNRRGSHRDWLITWTLTYLRKAQLNLTPHLTSY